MDKELRQYPLTLWREWKRASFVCCGSKWEAILPLTDPARLGFSCPKCGQIVKGN